MEYVLDPTLGDPAGVLATVHAKFSVVDDGKSKFHRRWYDTFDWRLHRAGLVLEQVGTQLTLTRDDGEQVVEVEHALGGPTFAAALPAGPLRDQLAPILGIRALLPVAETAGTATDLRVLNADEKTVVRITHDDAFLTVQPVRGYQAQADKVTKALANVEGVAPLQGSRLAAVLNGSGRRPGGYTGKVSIQLDRDDSATHAVTTILLDLLDTAEANVEGTIEDWDTEFLHDLRIAVRRTRTALKLCGDALPDGLAARYATQFKWLGDITTPTRDLDVYVLGFDSFGGSPDLEPFRAHLERQRGIAQRKLARSLRSVRFGKLLQTWRDKLAVVEDTGELTAGQLAAARIKHAHRRAVKRGSAITAESPAESLHDLRKRCKELRYLLEFFASLHDPAIHRGLIKDLKGLQDCLGEFQDNEVQAHAIRTFAAEMMAGGNATPETILAMGELTGRLDRGQQHAREEFAGRFARFASAENTARVKALLTGSAK